MARIVDSTTDLAAPRWAGDFGSPDLGLMRGGFQVDASAFDEADPLVIPSGTPVGRTLAERDAGDMFGPAADGDTEVYLIYFDIQDANINPDFVAYRPYAGRIVKENFLPDGWDTVAAVETALRARYNLIRGAD